MKKILSILLVLALALGMVVPVFATTITTVEPAETAEPETTVEPAETAEPETTVEPAETAEPETTVEPAETAEPETTVDTVKDGGCKHNRVRSEMDGSILVCRDCSANIFLGEGWMKCPHEFQYNDVESGIHIAYCKICDTEIHERHRYSQVETPEWHGEACLECGDIRFYEGHTFVEEFDSNSHWERCVDCDYCKVEPHEIVNDFVGEHHYKVCSECPYMDSAHNGAEYDAIDDVNCIARCTKCDEESISSHNWDGFVCRDCGRELSGPTVARVKAVFEREGYYKVKVDVYGETHYINLENISFEKGDWIVIEHNGNQNMKTLVTKPKQVLGTKHFPNGSILVITEYFPNGGYHAYSIPGDATIYDKSGKPLNITEITSGKSIIVYSSGVPVIVIKN